MDRVWREGIKIECTEGGSISDIMIQNVTMRDVTRPVFMILNNRFKTDDYGSSVELEQMPEIGRKYYDHPSDGGGFRRNEEHPLSFWQ